MQLVEQHVIDRHDPRYAAIDAVAFASKNLYNAANYEMRQAFIHEWRFLSYNQLDKLMQSHEAYKALPAKVAQWVLKGLVNNWKSFKEARERYQRDPSQFRGRPRLPKYKHKTDGRNLLVYTTQAISTPELRKGVIQPSQLGITVKTKQDPATIKQVRIVPKHGFYVVEVVYEKEPVQANVNPSLYAGLDPGVTNVAAIASNKAGFVPRLVNGRPIKACNQWYNKRLKQLKKKLPKRDRERVTRQMERITNKRNRRIDHDMHTASRRIIDLLVQEGIGTLIIGKNDGWKQEVEMGRQNNQAFVAIPHARFIDMLTYKAELVGIRVVLTEESYTSQASFLHRDEMPVYDPNRTEKPRFSGTRKGRFYYTNDGRRLHADVNGAYNMIRKVTSDAFQAEDVADAIVVHPVRIVRTKSQNMA